MYDVLTHSSRVYYYVCTAKPMTRQTVTHQPLSFQEDTVGSLETFIPSTDQSLSSAFLQCAFKFSRSPADIATVEARAAALYRL